MSTNINVLKKENEEINFQIFLSLYSNIALLNAVALCKEQNWSDELKNSITEQNFHELKYWKIKNQDKSITNKLEKLPFYNLINSYNKNLDLWKSDLPKPSSIKIEDFFQELFVYLRSIRNKYSHLDPKDPNYLKNDEKLKNLNNKFKDWYLKIFKNTQYFLFIKNFDDYDWQAFIVELFLNRLDFNDFLKNIEKVSNNFKALKDFLKNSTLSRNLRFRVKDIQIVSSSKEISLEVLNFIKSFNDNLKKNKSHFSMSIARKILNKYFEDKNIRFDFLKIEDNYENDQNINQKNKSINQKNKSILKFQNTKNDNFFYLNWNETRKLLLIIANNLNEKSEILSKLFKIGEHKHLESPTDLKVKFKSFQNRYLSESKINNRHLLKTLNRILGHDDENNVLKADYFEHIFQALELQEIKYIEKNESLKIFLKNLFLYEEKISIENFRKTILNFINKKLNSEEKFKEIILGNNKEVKNSNLWKNKFFPFFDLEQFKNIDLYSELFNFKNLKERFNKDEIKKQNEIKEYVAPILIFFFKELKKSKPNIKYVSVDKLISIEERKNLIISNEIFEKIFENAIEISKDIYKIEYLDENDQKISLDIQEASQLVKSNFEIINSKLFQNILMLENANKHKFNFLSLNLEKFKEIIQKYNWYRENELKLIKKYSYDFSEQEETRNKIMHRSLVKFKTWEEIKQLVNNLDLKYSNEIKIPENNNFSFKNTFNLDDELEEFKDKIQK